MRYAILVVFVTQFGCTSQHMWGFSSLPLATAAAQAIKDSWRGGGGNASGYCRTTVFAV